MFWLVLVILAVSWPLARPTCDAENEVKKTFLWSIQHPHHSAKGYLFGTIHVPYTEVWSEVSDRVREAFSYSDTLLLEVDLRDEVTLKKLIRCKNLRRRHSARSYLPRELFQRIQKLMVSFRKTLLNWAQKQPQMTHSNDSYKRAAEVYNSIGGSWERKRAEWLLFLLYQMCENVVDRPSSPMLDLYLAQKAFDDDKKIRAIETVAEQCNPVVSVSQQDIIFAIDYTVHYLEHIYSKQRAFPVKKGRSIGELVRQYRCGSLGEKVFNTDEISRNDLTANFEDRLRAERIDRQLRDDIIVRRNTRMATRLNQIFQSDTSNIVFSAIGTGHFFGNNSILNHLRDYGYTIEEVKENDLIVPPSKIGNRRKFNALWTRETSINNDEVVIEVVSDHCAHLHVSILFPTILIGLLFKFL